MTKKPIAGNGNQLKNKKTMEKFGGEFPFEKNTGDGFNITPEKGLSHGKEPQFSNEQRIPRPQNNIMNPVLAAAKKAALEADRKRAERVEKGCKKLSSGERFCKMDGVIRYFSDKQQNEGFPVGTDGRILMEKFSNAQNYGKKVIEENLANVKNTEKSFSLNSTTSGELMEMLTVGIFNKFFSGTDFVRTSKFDDFCAKNGASCVDAALFLNGVVIAVFDMAVKDNLTGKNEEERKKAAKINKTNDAGGAKLKYCIRKDVMRPEINIPAFHITLNSDIMDRAIDRFGLNNEQNDTERIAMYKIIDSIYNQIDVLEIKLNSGNILFDPRIGGEKNFAIRLRALKKHLEANLPHETVQAYLKEQVEKSKTGRKADRGKKNSR